jgi:Tol biopolymer transport system component
MKMLMSLGLCLLALTAGGCSKKPTQPPPTPEPIYPPFEVTNETIIFVSNIDGSQWNLQPGWNLFLMNSDGSNISPRTADIVNAAPCWSPDRMEITYERGGGTSTNLYHIYKMKNDGSKVVCLTPSTQYIECTSSWSPTEGTICFNRVDAISGGKQVYNLWLMDTSGANQRQLTFLEQGVGNQRYSPDGSKLIFDTSYLGANGFYYGAICIINPDGTDMQYLTPHQPADTNISCREPSWSPDGSKIAYACWWQDTMAVWIMNSDGLDKIKLTKRIGDVKDYHPSWSPDGTRITFARKERIDGQIVSDVWVINSDGTNQRRITFNNKSHEPTWR